MRTPMLNRVSFTWADVRAESRSSVDDDHPRIAGVTFSPSWTIPVKQVFVLSALRFTKLGSFSRQYRNARQNRKRTY
jgi:hypothetical protein